jgi:hypothetical protein
MKRSISDSEDQRGDDKDDIRVPLVDLPFAVVGIIVKECWSSLMVHSHLMLSRC